MSEREIDEKHAAFMRLFLSCEPRIYAFVRSAVFSSVDADDVLQEVSIVLWKKFDEFEKGSRFDSWAMEVTRIQILRFRQKKGRDRLVFGEELLGLIAEDSVGTREQLEEKRNALRKCLAQQDDADLTVLAKRYKEGMTGRAIAKFLGKSESAVSRALNRIHTNLLLCLRRRMRV